MGQESKEWVNVSRKLRKSESGGVFVYVDSETLRFSGITGVGKLEMKRQSLNNGKVLLHFRYKGG